MTGRPSFGASYASRATASGTSFILGSNPGIQPLDVNGDGFTDLVNARNASVLCNDGSGDWNGSACLMNSTLPDFASDGDSDPAGVRFFDYDDDKRIDALHTVATDSTLVYVNTPSGFVSRSVSPLGAVFDAGASTLSLSDMNGDGLQDAVELQTSGSLRYKTNLGFGRWTDWTTVSFPGFGGANLDQMSLQDINGDGMSDLVLVSGTEVRYAVNRNGGRFDGIVTLTSAEVEETFHRACWVARRCSTRT